MMISHKKKTRDKNNIWDYIIIIKKKRFVETQNNLKT